MATQKPAYEITEIQWLGGGVGEDMLFSQWLAYVIIIGVWIWLILIVIF